MFGLEVVMDVVWLLFGFKGCFNCVRYFVLELVLFVFWGVSLFWYEVILLVLMLIIVFLMIWINLVVMVKRFYDCD